MSQKRLIRLSQGLTRTSGERITVLGSTLRGRTPGDPRGTPATCAQDGGCGLLSSKLLAPVWAHGRGKSQSRQPLRGFWHKAGQWPWQVRASNSTAGGSDGNGGWEMRERRESSLAVLVSRSIGAVIYRHFGVGKLDKRGSWGQTWWKQFWKIPATMSNVKVEGKKPLHLPFPPPETLLSQVAG